MNEQSRIVMEIVPDSPDHEAARARRERFERNWAWLDRHAAEVYSQYRGKCVCVAGEELFVSDEPGEAMALAKADHPEDDGVFIRYIPRVPSSLSPPRGRR